MFVYSASLTRLYSSEKRVLLRKSITILLGLKYLGDREIEFQIGAFGCGVSCVKMLFKKIYNAKAIDAFGDKDLIAKHPMMSMFDICLFINNNGLKSKGFEFFAIDQLKKRLNVGSKKYSLLLMNNIDAYSGVTISFLLLFPLFLLKEGLSLLGLSPRQIYHWVLLDELGDRGVTLSDPLLGRVFVRNTRFERMWTKSAVVVEIEPYLLDEGKEQILY
jgi:predicted double-glycine peptidase